MTGKDIIMKNTALVIMAAGMGSRYGGNKQTDGMGPNGEILMEYSIRDAIRAGFTKVVFIIKDGMQALMRDLCGRKFEQQIEICYAVQDFSSVPGGVPEGRVKPFGTVHAVLCAKGYVNEPFAVINADDYYGVESFKQMHGFLQTVPDSGAAAMMGYMLRNTVSRHGAVTRGICQVDGGFLTAVREVKNVELRGDGSIANVTDPESAEALDPESPVSMNFWGFGPGVFEVLEREFTAFVKRIPEGDLKAEYLLPVFVDEQLHAGGMTVRVLNTPASWFGVTYREDRPRVAEALKKLHEEGVY